MQVQIKAWQLVIDTDVSNDLYNKFYNFYMECFHLAA